MKEKLQHETAPLDYGYIQEFFEIPPEAADNNGDPFAEATSSLLRNNEFMTMTMTFLISEYSTIMDRHGHPSQFDEKRKKQWIDTISGVTHPDNLQTNYKVIVSTMLNNLLGLNIPVPRGLKLAQVQLMTESNTMLKASRTEKKDGRDDYHKIQFWVRSCIHKLAILMEHIRADEAMGNTQTDGISQTGEYDLAYVLGKGETDA